MELKLRTATEQDAALIAQLADRIWRKHYISIISLAQIEFMLDTMYNKESLLQQMAAGQTFTLVFDGEKPVGYISISNKDSRNYFLHKFYIETDEQRKGIGSWLFGHVLAEMKGAETIELTVNRQNHKAINFYFKQGFVIKEVADFDIGNGYFMNDFVMVRNNKLK